MTALGFALGVGYVLAGMLVLVWFVERFGTRLGRRLERSLALQLTALAVWPATLIADLLMLRLFGRNRRCY